MELVASFGQLLQPFAPLMTAPTFANFQTIVCGWVFAEQRTITSMILAAGAVNGKHFSVYHRFFANANWSLQALGFTILDLVEPWLDEVVMLALDDTLARKHGRKMYGAGMHHDPLLSSRGQAVMNYGHCWVVLAVVVRLPFCPWRFFALPVLFALYLNEKSSAKHRLVHRTKPELAVDLLRQLRRRYPDRRFHVLADSAYGGVSVLGELPPGFDLTSRLTQDARLHELPQPKQPGTRGRPRVRGAALPNPAKMLEGRCRRLAMDLYGRRDRLRVAEVVACVYKVPGRLLRIVAVDPLTGGRKRQAFYSTCWDTTAEQILAWYAMRWAIEVAFHDAKGCLGFEEPQNWSRQAVRRTAPMAMLLYSLILVWYATAGSELEQLVRLPWYRHKRHASFADMLATLRRASIAANISGPPARGGGYEKPPWPGAASAPLAA